MDNYKIKVKDEAVFAEVVALCEQISGKSFPYPNISCDPDLWIFIGPEGAFGWSLDLDHSWSGLDLKELTLPQLRDLVVLKRNDVRDATHEDQYGDKWLYLDERHYVYLNYQWGLPTGEFLERYELKPIEKSQPQDPALISGAEAYDLIGKRIEVEALCSKGDGTFKWEDAKHLPACDILNDGFDFRLKPQTIKVELELPKPFEPKEGDIYWFITPNHSTGYDFSEFDNSQGDKLLLQYGVYRTEDDVKKAVEQLRKIRGAS
ncbi:hypothetical protein [Acinetobacter geminorum]|uniref:hypothetical protein n=1 Tax=Acinetobacter geminorum TaxID=2730922 RepID=UPI003AF6C0F7